MKFTKRWGYEMSANSVRPGIYRLKEGGYFVTLSVTDPRGHRKLSCQKLLRGALLEDARRWRDAERDRLRERLLGRAQQRMLFSEFAASHFEAKVAAGDIKSAAGREKWKIALENHIVPRFGDIYCSELRYADFEEWRGELAGKVNREVLSPRTVNGWFSILRGVCKAMRATFELPRNPAEGLTDFDTSQKPTYTDEKPNSLTGEWATKFLGEMRKHWPQFYAMTLLGFVTGKRPSTLRPLRRSGPHADVEWETGVVRFRRSNSRGQEVMHGTKTGKVERVHLPDEVMAVLQWHVDELKRPRQRDSLLLFPSFRGGMRARSVLDKPFADVAKRIKLPFRVTPRAMRRSFNDLARAAGVHDVVTRKISGHLTEAMQEHYSTADAKEQRQAIAKVIRLVDARPKKRAHGHG